MHCILRILSIVPVSIPESGSHIRWTTHLRRSVRQDANIRTLLVYAFTTFLNFVCSEHVVSVVAGK